MASYTCQVAKIESPQMPHLSPVKEEDWSPSVREIMQRWHKNYGRPSHILSIIAANPKFLEIAALSWEALVNSKSHIPTWIKHCIVLITCSTQNTLYCVQGHSHAIRRLGVLDDQQIENIKNFEFGGFNATEHAIFSFVHKCANDPKSMSKIDYELLRDSGIRDEEILEILSVIWINTAMNMIVDALDVKRTPEQMKELESLD